MELNKDNFKGKRLLILGAMEKHVPLINRANELGIYTITCDYFENVPGHKIAKESHIVSTTDLEAVLNVAKKSHIDGIMTYLSDPAAPTAAYVAEKLGLPGNSYKTVRIMHEKNLFRAFLKDNNFNVPGFVILTKKYSLEEDEINKLRYPLVIKPIDSCGSRGVSIARNREDVESCVKVAFESSKIGKVIIEEYIIPQGRQLDGDGFVQNGKLVFLYLGDQYFDEDSGNLIIRSTAFYTQQGDDSMKSIKETIQNFMIAVGFKNGGFNVELRLSKEDGKIYIIDIGARNGGPYYPEQIEYATGFNFLDAALAVSLGEKSVSKRLKYNDTYTSHVLIKAEREGILKKVILSPEIKKHILESYMYKHKGDKINTFKDTNDAIGILILKYENREIMNKIITNFSKLYKIEFEK